MARELVSLGRYEDALLATDEFLRSHADDSRMSDVGYVLLSKATALGNLDRNEEAIAVLQEIDRQLEGLRGRNVDEIRTSAQEFKSYLNNRTAREVEK
jgi:hypothetical protein